MTKKAKLKKKNYKKTPKKAKLMMGKLTNNRKNKLWDHLNSLR